MKSASDHSPVVGSAGLAGLPPGAFARRYGDEESASRAQGPGNFRQHGRQVARLHVLENVKRDRGVIGTVEVVVDHVQTVDLFATGPLQVDECLGDVRTADLQSGFLESIGIPPRT
jgi:hypothetical protein